MSSLFLLQLLHTLVTAWNYAALFYMIYAHAVGKRGFLLTLSYASIAMEGLAILPFRLTCPLRVLVTRLYSAETPDILIPMPWSDWIMPTGMALLLLALLLRMARPVAQESASAAPD